MKRAGLKKRIVSIILILLLILCAIYMCCKYILLPYALGQVLHPKISKADIKHAEELLLKIENLIVYSTNMYEEKEVNGQVFSGIRYIEELKDNNVNFVVVEHNIIKEKFKKAKYKPEFIVWKGHKLGVATLTNGDEMIIRISDYGDFFSIEGIEGFYEFDKI